MIAQSLHRLSTGWTVRGSNPDEGRFSTPVQAAPGAHPASHTIDMGSFPAVKWPGRGFDHSLISSAEVKEREELYLYPPPMGLRVLVLG